jgi:hypothetical protein
MWLHSSKHRIQPNKIMEESNPLLKICNQSVNHLLLYTSHRELHNLFSREGKILLIILHSTIICIQNLLININIIQCGAYKTRTHIITTVALGFAIKLTHLIIRKIFIRLLRCALVAWLILVTGLGDTHLLELTLLQRL